jgi:hypothetical protein
MGPGRWPLALSSAKWKGFPRRFYVHACQAFDQAGYAWVVDELGVALPAPAPIKRGGLIGAVHLVDVVTASASRWFTGPYGFALADPFPFDLVPYRGRLGFFDVVLDTVRAAQRSSEAGQLLLL